MRIDVSSAKVNAPEVAVDPAGNLIVLWLEGEDGSASRVLASLFTVRGWHTPEVLNPDAPGDMPAYQPKIASDGRGNFFAAWSQTWKIQDDSRIGVYARRYAPGSGWGSVTSLYAGEDGGSATGALDLAAGAGNATAVWVGNDALWSQLGIHAARYGSGSGWRPHQIISAPGTQSATPPAVAMDLAGNAMAVWGQSAGDDRAAKGAHAARCVGAGDWESPVAIEPADVAEIMSSAATRVGFDAAGDAIALWSHSAYPGIFANRWSQASGWGSAVEIPGLPSAGVDEEVQLAIDQQGNAMALWNRAGSLFSSHTQRGVWSAAELVEAGPADLGRIAAGPDGRVVAAWIRRADQTVLTNRFLPNEGWTGPAPVSSSKKASHPRLAIDGTGMATVVWQQDDGLYAARTFIGR
jgi:hypothetical protein